MTEAFRSTDGYTITRNRRGEVVVLKPSGDKITGGGPIGACLGEYIDSLVALRDAELGRWRWPENPDYVVYPIGDGDGVLAASERSGRSLQVSRRPESFHHRTPRGASDLARAASAYFEAHPASKPWQCAKEGEGWVVTIGGEERLATVQESYFWIGSEAYRQFGDDVTAARKVWPEDAS